jgi:hypothetical protein
MVIIVIILAIQIVRLIPWQYIGLSSRSRSEQGRVAPQGEFSPLGVQPGKSATLPPVEPEITTTHSVPVASEERSAISPQRQAKEEGQEDSPPLLSSSRI